MRTTIVVCACLAFALAAPAAGQRAGAPACPTSLPNRLSSTGEATQLITVVAEHRTATRGSLRLWQKADGCWRPVAGPWSAWLGGRGVSADRREGDRTTPVGSFGIGRTMYGVAPNPGVRYRYRRIVCGDWWVEDPRSPYYNQFRHVRCGSKPPFAVVSDDLSRAGRPGTRQRDLPPRQYRQAHARVHQPAARAARDDAPLAATGKRAPDRDRDARGLPPALTRAGGDRPTNLKLLPERRSRAGKAKRSRRAAALEGEQVDVQPHVA
jgi:L,D-peptidoglycan transpeptidase YkuD (ErfK/YbiS/YcfS/YnhG family)